ncbi:MAG TPA: hypothetical protein VGE43_19510 [Acidimicrobiales bacterium]
MSGEADPYVGHGTSEGELLRLAYTALNSIRRLGYPLDENWPAEADEAYDRIGEHLWPSVGSAR